MVANEMAIEFDMFGSFMENGVGCNVKGGLIITMHGDGMRMWNMKIMKK